jgi:hypothetical protein
VAGSVSCLSLIISIDLSWSRISGCGVMVADFRLLTNRYGEDKDLTEDYAKDIWEFGY